MANDRGGARQILQFVLGLALIALVILVYRALRTPNEEQTSVTFKRITPGAEIKITEKQLREMQSPVRAPEEEQNLPKGAPTPPVAFQSRPSGLMSEPSAGKPTPPPGPRSRASLDEPEAGQPTPIIPPIVGTMPQLAPLANPQPRATTPAAQVQPPQAWVPMTEAQEAAMARMPHQPQVRTPEQAQAEAQAVANEAAQSRMAKPADPSKLAKQRQEAENGAAWEKAQNAKRGR